MKSVHGQWKRNSSLQECWSGRMCEILKCSWSRISKDDGSVVSRFRFQLDFSSFISDLTHDGYAFGFPLMVTNWNWWCPLMFPPFATCNGWPVDSLRLAWMEMDWKQKPCQPACSEQSSISLCRNHFINDRIKCNWWGFSPANMNNKPLF